MRVTDAAFKSQHSESKIDHAGARYNKAWIDIAAG
jgi:hypothetical protein